jgi:hypothetical protein
MIFLVGDVGFLRFVAVLVVCEFAFAFTAFGRFLSRKDLDLCLNLDLDLDLDLDLWERERKDRALLLLVLPSLEQLISSEETFSLPWCPLFFIKDDGNRIFMLVVTIPAPLHSLGCNTTMTPFRVPALIRPLPVNSEYKTRVVRLLHEKAQSLFVFAFLSELRVWKACTPPQHEQICTKMVRLLL